jgi:hypothetical protein
VSHNIITCNAYRHDFDALRNATDPHRRRRRRQVRPAAGRPRGRGRGRTARDRAGHLPGDHGGFLGGEYGQTGEPDAFAATLREVLTA